MANEKLQQLILLKRFFQPLTTVRAIYNFFTNSNKELFKFVHYISDDEVIISLDDIILIQETEPSDPMLIVVLSKSHFLYLYKYEVLFVQTSTSQNRILLHITRDKYILNSYYDNSELFNSILHDYSFDDLVSFAKEQDKKDFQEDNIKFSLDLDNLYF